MDSKSQVPEIVVVPPEGQKYKTHKTCGCLFLILVSIAVIVIGVIKICLSSSKPPEYVVVETSLGKVKGVVLDRSPRPVTAFYGIPFAQPPVGHLRFKKPSPVSAWTPKVLEATKHPLACFQLILNHPLTKTNPRLMQLVEKFPQGEDCLYLNVFVPGKEVNGSKKAVMVWIHGGFFVAGNLEYYDPSQLASHGDVIIVAIQYRLGIFGFMQSTDPEEIPGNMGLHDQFEALSWVEKHIESFGGDKNRVTLFGESAGGISVGFHMISNKSRKLFQRAILQSGSPLTIMAAGIDMGPIYVEKVASLLHCPYTSRKVTGGKYSQFHDDTHRCLRNADAKSLREAEKYLIKNRKTFGFIPTMDEDFFPEHPLEFFRSEHPFYDNHTTIMMGHTGNEGGMFLHYSLPDLFPENGKLPSNLSYDMISDKLSRIAPNREVQIKFIFAELIKATKTDSPFNIAFKFSKLMADGGIVCPNLLMMDSFTRFPKNKVYYYQFDTRPKNAKTYSWSKAAVHEEEMQFVFGYPFSKRDQGYTNEERSFSAKVMSHWSNFAKTGVPHRDWRPCTGDERNYRYYDTDMKIKDEEGLPDNSCVSFYETMYEQLRERYRFRELK